MAVAPAVGARIEPVPTPISDTSVRLERVRSVYLYTPAGIKMVPLPTAAIAAAIALSFWLALADDARPKSTALSTNACVSAINIPGVAANIRRLPHLYT